MISILNAIGSKIVDEISSKGISSLWENRKTFSLYFKTNYGKYKNEKIRFSMSYLFKIRIPGTNSFLLVENRRIKNQLQPVGGCYKRYGDDKLFEDWNAIMDSRTNGLGVDEISCHDLRFSVIGKHVLSVLKWFDEGREREVSGNREFHEELIETEILDEKIFKVIKYRHLKRIAKYLKWSPHHNCYEVLIYDILELLPNDKQATYLKELAQNPINLSKGYAIVDVDEIGQLRLLQGNEQIARIGEHTKLIINQN